MSRFSAQGLLAGRTADPLLPVSEQSSADFFKWNTTFLAKAFSRPLQQFDELRVSAQRPGFQVQLVDLDHGTDRVTPLREHDRLRLGHRDEFLRPILNELEQHRTFSRGRFGAWKYEVSNQDHSFMQGVELVNRLVQGEPETTIANPECVNSGAFSRSGYLTNARTRR